MVLPYLQNCQMACRGSFRGVYPRSMLSPIRGVNSSNKYRTKHPPHHYRFTLNQLISNNEIQHLHTPISNQAISSSNKQITYTYVAARPPFPAPEPLTRPSFQPSFPPHRAITKPRGRDHRLSTPWQIARLSSANLTHLPHPFT